MVSQVQERIELEDVLFCIYAVKLQTVNLTQSENELAFTFSGTLWVDLHL